MIRPSALQMAESCGLASQLAEQHPEQSDASARGHAIHAEIAHLLRTYPPGEPDPAKYSPEAIAAWLWVRVAHGDAPTVLAVEQHMQLKDPETGDLITEGTPDLVVVYDDHVAIIDWKTGNPANVAHGEDNLQLAAYALAAAIKFGVEKYVVGCVFLDEGRTFPGHSEEVSDMWPMLARVKAAASREPIATPGDHCQGCWSRTYCDAWKSRTEVALTLLPTAGAELALTDEDAGALVLRLKAVREAADYAEDLVKAHVRNGGRAVNAKGQTYKPSQVAGRTTADMEAIKRDGAVQYLKVGKPYERWGWGK